MRLWFAGGEWSGGGKKHRIKEWKTKCTMQNNKLPQTNLHPDKYTCFIQHPKGLIQGRPTSEDWCGLRPSFLLPRSCCEVQHAWYFPCERHPHCRLHKGRLWCKFSAEQVCLRSYDFVIIATKRLSHWRWNYRTDQKSQQLHLIHFSPSNTIQEWRYTRKSTSDCLKEGDEKKRYRTRVAMHLRGLKDKLD